jgi:hypothetical protein
MLPTSRQGRLYKGYGILVQNVNSVEEKLLNLEVGQLAAYFRDVSMYSSPSTSLFHIKKPISCTRAPGVPVVTMLPV